jgi:hypothetical protein
VILGDRINGLLFVRGQLDKGDGIGRGTAGKIPWKFAGADRAVFALRKRVALVAGRLRLFFISGEPGFIRWLAGRAGGIGRIVHRTALAMW